MNEVSFDDARTFVESRGYACVPLDPPGDNSGLTTMTLENMRAPLFWLCVALFAFFAFRLFNVDRRKTLTKTHHK